MSFVKCQFCAGHAMVSEEAEAAVATALEEHLRTRAHREIDGPLLCELENIRNAIYNAAARRIQDPEPLELIDPLLE